METIYHMTCGCRLEYKDLIRKHKGCFCSKHPIGRNRGRVEHIEKECCDCGDLMVLMPRQYNSIRCDSCKARKKRGIDREYYHNVVAPSIVQKPMSASKSRLLKKQCQKMDISLYTQGLSRYLPKTQGV